MVARKNKSIGMLLSLSLLIVLGLVWLVVAATSDLISVDVINTSSNGWQTRSSNGFYTNGTGYFYQNISGNVLLNISLIRNGTHENFMNVSFGFISTTPEGYNPLPYASGVTVLNVTLINSTVNQSSFNYSAASSGIRDGYFNISIMVWGNVTNGSNDLSIAVINLSRVINVLIDNNAPPINNFYFNMSNNSNISSNRKLTFNVTANDSIFTQSVRIGFTNDFANGSQFNVTATRNISLPFNGSSFSAEIDTALMSDGTYIVTVYANDSLRNANVTVSNATFMLDRSGPNVSVDTLVFGNHSGYATHTGGYVGINLSAGLSEGNYTLQISVNDSLVHVQTVQFNLTNRSGSVSGSVYPFNHTAVKNQTNYTTGSTGAGDVATRGNLNISRLAEGWYNLTVWTNDSFDNVNNSLRMTFVIDRTKPAVSVSCSPSAATVGDTVTCTCTTSDEYPGSGRLNGWGFSGSNPTESTTATGSGTFTSGTCTVLDYAGNRNTATGTWTVTAATSGGGGGGGSGGGSSSGATGQFEQKTWTSINTGETATVEVENGVIGVTAVSFAVTDTVYGAWVKVEKESALPSTVSSFSGDTYRVIEITKGTALKDDKFTKATIDFKVEKKWLADNDLGKERVALHRFADGKWNELPTTVGQDDGTYVHYKAETPGFSYFVIGEKKTAAAPVAPAEEVPVEEALAEVPAEEAPVEEAAEVTKKTKVWSFVAVLLVIAAIVVILVALKKRK